jgi:hypothetical protein
MPHIRAIIIQSEYKILAELQTDIDPQQLYDWLDLDQPEWYPIQGGWLITNRYSKHQTSLLDLLKPFGFVYKGVHYPHNGIILQGNLKSFYLNQDLDVDFAAHYMEQIGFYGLTYNPETDQTLDTEDF